MKVSIKEISQRTGFSPATVSNALNMKKGVNKETAEKIFRVAEELGYSNKDKISKIKFVVYRKNGKIIDDSQFHPAVIAGVEKQAKDRGYETIFCHINCEVPGYGEQLSEILNDTSSAVILLGTEMEEEDFRLVSNHKCQLILLDGWSDYITFDSVLINNTDAAYYATKYLIEKGHEKIGYIKGDFRIQAFKYREMGYQRAMTEKSYPVIGEVQVVVGTGLESAYADMRNYLEGAQELPTAFFADNDVIAIGAMRAIKEKGFRVPEDISIVGFDDLSFGAISTPGLTTTRVLKQEMGQIAVNRLLEVVQEGNRAKTKIQVCTEFIERESVANLGKPRDRFMESI